MRQHPFATATRAALPAVLAATLIGAALPAQAQQVLPTGSEIVFVSKQMGVPVEGRFRRFSAQISFNPRQPAAGQVAFTIDTGSATLGSPEGDAELPKPEWFSVLRFPQASFRSRAITALGGGRFEVRGQLSLKGQTQDVSVPVTLAQQGSNGSASGSFTIRRLDFHIGDGDWADTSMVANDVQVRFKLALTGLAAP